MCKTFCSAILLKPLATYTILPFLSNSDVLICSSVSGKITLTVKDVAAAAFHHLRQTPNYLERQYFLSLHREYIESHLKLNYGVDVRNKELTVFDVYRMVGEGRPEERKNLNVVFINEIFTLIFLRHIISVELGYKKQKSSKRSTNPELKTTNNQKRRKH